MRAIVLTSLVLVIVSLAGCQSRKVAYQVETQITPFPDTNQYLVEMKIIELGPTENRVLASPSTMVAQGKEAKMGVSVPSGATIDCGVLISQATSSTSVSLSKKGKVFWSSEQTTRMKSEDQASVTSIGKLSRSKHDEDVIEALNSRFKDADSKSRL